MKVCLFAVRRNSNQAKRIADILEQQHVECPIFYDYGALYNNFKDFEVPPDLALLDYMGFNHVIMNVYSFLQEVGCRITALLYNDPYEENRKDLLSYWQEILTFVYPRDRFNWHSHKDLLTIISGVFSEIEENGGSIPVETEKYLCHIGKEPNAVNRLLQKNITTHLSTTYLLIYEKLVLNEGIVVPLETLKKEIGRNGKLPSNSTIICAISKIRKVLHDFSSESIEIIKNGDGYRLILK